jgi:hypothetical protein
MLINDVKMSISDLSYIFIRGASHLRAAEPFGQRSKKGRRLPALGGVVAAWLELYSKFNDV